MATNPTTMRAWVYRKHGKPADVLKIENDVPVPKAPHLPILVKVHAAALNPVGYKLMSEFPSFMVKKPCVPEADYAGVVAGGDLSGTDLQVGDEVFGFLPVDLGNEQLGAGSLGEYTIANKSLLVKKPKNLSFAQAAGTALAGKTAYVCLVKKGGIQAGQRVLINGGTGGVGLWAIQIAKALGCYTVATCSSGSFDLVKSLGADEVVDYKEGNLEDNLSRSYGKTNDTKFDVIFDTIGTYELYHKAKHFVKHSGSFVAISAKTDSFLHILKTGFTLGCAMYCPRWLGGNPISFKFFFLKGDGDSDTIPQLGKWLEEGKLRPVVDSEYAFEDALKAYERMMSGRAKGKIVVNIV